MGYVIAAYGIVLVVLLVYWAVLTRQRRALQRELREAGRDAEPGAPG